MDKTAANGKMSEEVSGWLEEISDAQAREKEWRKFAS